MAGCVGLVRFLASYAAVPEKVVNLSFGQMFFYRFLPPSTRDRLLAKSGIAPAPVSPAPAPVREGQNS
jgi:hypothetical protein